jgi:molybdate transport system ATP-binding protein
MNLRIENLSYHAGKLHLELLHEFEGRIAGIFGPSGAGKTTLLELIAGFRRPNAGMIRFGERILNDASRKYSLPSHQRNIGYVPQDLALFPHLSVEANMKYGWRRKQDHRIPDIREIVRLLDLQALLQRDIALLSGGEKQRVAFARAILASPELMLVDEPLSNLNQELRAKIKELILIIRDEFRIPILFVSHDADDVVALCDQVLFLENGKKMQSGPADTLFIPDDRQHYRLRN